MHREAESTITSPRQGRPCFVPIPLQFDIQTTFAPRHLAFLDCPFLALDNTYHAQPTPLLAAVSHTSQLQES